MRDQDFDRCVFYFQMSDAEWAVVQLSLQAWPIAKIADKLCLASGSVKFHITNVLKKAGVKSRLELMYMYFKAKYMQEGLIGGQQKIEPMQSPSEQ